MARLGSLGKELELVVKDFTGPAAVQAFADFSRRARDEVINDQRSKSGVAPHVTTAVNGRVGASEETVKLPGPIVYTFDYGAEVAAYLLEFLQARAPKDSGYYAKGFFFIQHGRRHAWAQSMVPGVEFYISNDRPYSRKIEVGFMNMRVPPHIFEDARQAAQRRFGNVATFQMAYLDLAGGYVLKGRFRRGVRKHARKALRADTAAGQRMRYPSILVTPR